MPTRAAHSEHSRAAMGADEEEVVEGEKRRGEALAGEGERGVRVTDGREALVVTGALAGVPAASAFKGGADAPAVVGDGVCGRAVVGEPAAM